MKRVWKLWIVLALCLINPLKLSAKEIEVDPISEAWVLIDAQSERVLEGENIDKIIYPASMTKIMTLLVAVETFTDLDATVTINDEMLSGLAEANASIAGFVSGETVSVRDLFYGILLPSGADACRAVAMMVAGSEAAYVTLMNAKADELGLTHTHFVNTTGLHEENHVSTVREISHLLKTALENPVFAAFFETKEAVTSSTPYHPYGISLVSSTFRYAQEMDYLIGGKTGFTYEAGLCLASAAKQDGMELILVSAGAPAELGYQPIHVQDAKLIYDAAFAAYHSESLIKQGEAVSSLTVKQKFKDNELPFTAPYEITAIIPKDVDVLECENVLMNDSLLPPIKKGDLIQKLTIRYEGEVLAELNFYAEEDIETDLLFQLFTKENCLLMFVAVILISALLIRWQRYKKDNQPTCE